jgi:hypothetical protein
MLLRSDCSMQANECRSVSSDHPLCRRTALKNSARDKALQKSLADCVHTNCPNSIAQPPASNRATIFCRIILLGKQDHQQQ